MYLIWKYYIVNKMAASAILSCKMYVNEISTHKTYNNILNKNLIQDYRKRNIFTSCVSKYNIINKQRLQCILYRKM